MGSFMNRLISRAVTAAAALAVAGGAALATALPASAAVLPRAWGAQASGNVSLGQVALAYPGHTPATAFGLPLNSVLYTGFILDRAGPATSSSQVQGPAVLASTALALVGATKVTSQCTRGLSGTSLVYGGQIVQYGRPTLNLPLRPGVNTQIKIPGGVTITLNKQGTALGVRQVTAIYVSWAGQNVSVGVTRC
jgi:hypothetical protein